MFTAPCLNKFDDVKPLPILCLYTSAGLPLFILIQRDSKLLHNIHNSSKHVCKTWLRLLGIEGLLVFNLIRQESKMNYCTSCERPNEANVHQCRNLDSSERGYVTLNCNSVPIVDDILVHCYIVHVLVRCYTWLHGYIVHV